MATKITSPIGGFLDVNNPEFLKEFAGKKLVFAEQGKNHEYAPMYEVRADGVYDLGSFNPHIPNVNPIIFGKTQGLGFPWKSSYSTSEAFKYFTTPEKEAARLATSDFGMGAGGTFRVRNEGESLYDYLEAKKGAGVGDIQLGVNPAIPTFEERQKFAQMTPEQIAQFKIKNPGVFEAAMTNNQISAEYLGGGGVAQQTIIGASQADVEEKARAAGINPANLYGQFWLKQNEPIAIPKVEEKIPTAVDLTKPASTSAVQKSAEMNQMLSRVKESYDNHPLKGNATANSAFIQAAAQSAKGRAANQAELDSLVGKTLDQVISHFGLGDRMGILVTPAVEGRKIADPAELQKFAQAGLTEADITRVGQDIYIKPKSPFLARLSPTGDIVQPAGQTEAPGAQSVLDRMQDLVDTFAADKKAARTTAKTEEGVTGIASELTEAQKKSNNLLTGIDQKRTQLEAQGILNEEAKIALKNKIQGQAIPMSTLNRQLLAGTQDLDQQQRLDRLYDVYELNSSINQYNAELRNQDLLQGRYDKAMERVKETVDDWVTEKELQLQILGEEGKIKTEERTRYQTEINYQRGLLEKGYAEVPDVKTYNKLVSDLQVTAETYSKFFYKDPSNGKIYLRSDANASDEKKLVLGFVEKYPDAGILPSDSLSAAYAKIPNSRVYQKETRISSGSTPTDTVDQEDKISINADILAITGTDGFVDTAKYELLRRDVAVNNSKLLSWFDSTYPPSKLLNPNDPTAKRLIQTQTQRAGEFVGGDEGEDKPSDTEKKLLDYLELVKSKGRKAIIKDLKDNGWTEPFPSVVIDWLDENFPE